MAEAIGILLVVLLGTGIPAFVAFLVLRTRINRLERKLRELEVSIEERVFRPPEAAPVEPATISPPAVRQLPPKPAATTAQPVDTGVAPRPAAARPVPASREDRLEALERRLGTRWLNWAGALTILVALAFFLKLVYDQGWVGPAGRVGIGLAFGLGLLLLGETKLRRQHDLLSQAVSAAGCGALFLTTYLSYQFYGFGGRAATFGFLVWFAAFTMALAVLRRGQVLSVLGLLGAYVTPILLSTGEDKAEVLFAYLALVAVGAGVVYALRAWVAMPAICTVSTWIYYAGWFDEFFRPAREAVAASGAAVLMVLGTAAVMSRSLSTRSPLKEGETALLAANELAGFVGVWLALADGHPAVLGLLLCAMSVANAAVLRLARRRGCTTAVVESALLLLATGSLLAVIPACLESEGAMVAWAIGGVVTAELASQTRRRALDVAVGVCLLAPIWAGIDGGVHHEGVFHPLLNRVFTAWLAVIAAWFVAGRSHVRRALDRSEEWFAGQGVQVLSLFMLLGLLSYETNSWFDGRMTLTGADRVALGGWKEFTLLLLWGVYPFVWRWRPDKRGVWLLTACYYAVISPFYLGRLAHLHGAHTVPFLNPQFGVALLVPAGLLFAGWNLRRSSRFGAAFQVLGHSLLVTLLSVEVATAGYASAAADQRGWIRMALLSVVWAGYALAILGVGIRFDFKSWRWTALVLLGGTLLKVVMVDMAAVRQIWRVVSFLVLGAVLMLCSYAYSRREQMRRRRPDVGPAGGVR